MHRPPRLDSTTRRASPTSPWGALLGVVSTLALACSGPSTPREAPPSVPRSCDRDPAGGATSARGDEAASARPTEPPPPVATSSTTAASGTAAPAPAPSVDVWCKTDAECGWDDPCAPKRCGKADRAPANCTATAAPPGACRCVESRCTLEPTTRPEPAVTGCTSDAECKVDRGGGTCGGGDATWVIHREGPLCQCDVARGACVYTWVGPVKCTSFRDCSWERSPMRPAPASRVPRKVPRPVVPCSTGEFDSVCVEGTCQIVAWSC